jgi:type III restriction enzyme
MPADVLLQPFTPGCWTYTAAAGLAANYHLPTPNCWPPFAPCTAKAGEVPEHHLDALGQQIEAQRSQYEETWMKSTWPSHWSRPMALTVTEVDGQPVYTARISFDKKNVSRCT